MANFIKALVRGVKAMAEGPDAPAGDTFVIAGKPLRCPHCGYDRFDDFRIRVGTALLTSGSGFVTSLTCVKCGRIELFDTDGVGID